MRSWSVWMVSATIAGILATASPVLRVAGAEDVGVNPITKVQPGMTMLQVLQTLGPPSDIVENAFYYPRKGKVIFASKGNPLDGTKVEKIEPSSIQNPVP